MATPPPPLSILSRAVRVRRPRLSRRLSQLSAAGMVAPVVALVASALLAEIHLDPARGVPGEIIGGLIWLWFLGVPTLSLLSALVGAIAPARRGRIEVDEAGLVLRRKRRTSRIDARTIEAGLVVPLGTRSALDLHLADGRVLRVEMAEEEAEAVLDRLGIGPDRRRVSVTLGSESAPIITGCLTFIFATLLSGFAVAAISLLLSSGWISGLAYLLVAAGVVVAPFAVRRLTSPAEVVIGVDGVLVRRAGRSRLLPYAIIDRAVEGHGALLLRLRPRAADGFVEWVRVEGNDDSVALGLVNRIEAMMAGSDDDAAQPVRELDPGGRSFEAWRAALTKLRRGEGEYRRAPLDARALRAVLEDGGAPPKVRIGAALALREGDDGGDERARVRLAAEACADEDLRAALEAAAADEVEEGAIRKVLTAKPG